jgi:transcriptional regulator with XRE-family HTH domain
MGLSRLTKQRRVGSGPDLAVELGGRIRAAREALGMSQTELGRPLTRAYVSQVESGRTLPSLPALLHLAERLGVAPGLLLQSRQAGRQGYTRDDGISDPLDRPPSG